MRILKIRFKNLNSLVGEWEIDLTHPAFVLDGIFAIIGPTGAGKTTILDAICLALYGRTPRLQKITKSENEIMARQTGECFSEVTFETQAGRFRAHWSQRRARKKPDGELQAPKHEIADADSNQIFEEKLRDVATRIERVTGMNFERFTQSMLLAQGSFAAFLQAEPDVRAPILEQITGTAIYGQISMYIHERRSDERKKLDMMLAELAGVRLLSDEAEQQLRANLIQKLPQELELNQQIKQKNMALVWLEQIDAIQKDLIHINGQQHHLLIRVETFKPLQEKLDRAKQALELSAEYAVMDSLRKEQKNIRQTYHDCQQLLPELEAKYKLAMDALNILNESLEQKRAHQKELIPIIRHTRKLDVKLQEKKAPMKELGDVLNVLEKSKVSLLDSHREDCRVLDAQKSVFDAIQVRRQETKIDASLIEHFGGIRGRFDVLRGLYQTQLAKVDELSVVEVDKAQAIGLWQQKSALFTTKSNEFKSLRCTFDQQKIELNQILADRSLADWRNQLTVFCEKRSVLDKIIESRRTVSILEGALDEINKRHERLITDNNEAAKLILEQVEACDALEREIQLLEVELSTLKTIQGFEAARHQLQDDKPCPLCGSNEHPFATGHVPVPDEIIVSLKHARRLFKKANDVLSTLKIKQVEITKDQEQMVIQQKELIEKIALEKDVIYQEMAILPLDDSKNIGEILQNLHQENSERLQKISGVVKAGDDYEKKINALSTSYETGREALALFERDVQAAQYNKESAEQAVERVKKELGALDTLLHKTERDALDELSEYGVQSLSLATLDPIQLDLASRRDQWLVLQKQQSDIEKNIAALEPKIQYQLKNMGELDSELEIKRGMLKTFVSENDDLMHERATLFGVKNPDDEEIRLSSLIEACDKQLEVARKSVSQAEQECFKLRTNIELFETTMMTGGVKLQQEEEAFHRRLHQFNFTDEANYVSACLSEFDRNQLIQQALQLADEHIALETRKKDKVTLLEVEQSKHLTEQSYEQLVEELNVFKINLNELQQQIGAIGESLKSNDTLRQKQHEKVKMIDRQKVEFARWDTLHVLIGSADGKKYRNFAQGLTFEMMIGHANRQLLKMTDRYLLIRDDLQPLELNVVDNYQAGEVRSTKNLSGGEGFMVSLSLALGLSHMASKNVRVDSLFLDEGFGTLDEEALDTALETLAGLQQNGKLIGVISHVVTLKERISTQIQISHQTGGRSTISGPGCSQLGSTL